MCHRPLQTRCFSPSRHGSAHNASAPRFPLASVGLPGCSIAALGPHMSYYVAHPYGTCSSSASYAVAPCRPTPAPTGRPSAPLPIPHPINSAAKTATSHIIGIQPLAWYVHRVAFGMVCTPCCLWQPSLCGWHWLLRHASFSAARKQACSASSGVCCLIALCVRDCGWGAVGVCAGMRWSYRFDWVCTPCLSGVCTVLAPMLSETQDGATCLGA